MFFINNGIINGRSLVVNAYEFRIVTFWFVN